MKQKYFTVENINAKSKIMLKKALKNAPKRNIKLRFERSALIVLDMQNFFLEKNSHAFIPSAVAIMGNIQNLIKVFHKHNRPVIFTKHINTQKNAGLMKIFWKDLLSKNSLSRISDKLNTKNSVIINKTQYDAFYKTELEKILKQKKVKHLVIAGVMTNLCCETTARSAFVRGFMPFFPVDTTAAYNEQFHTASLTNVAYGFALVDKISKIMGGLWSK